MFHVGLKKTLSAMLSHRRDFLPSGVPRQLKELYYAHAVFAFATAAGFLFEPIYLLTIGFSLSHIMFFFCAVYTLYFFLLPLGGKIAKHSGFEHSMIYGSLFMILYYVFLLLIQVHPLFVIGAVCALALQKSVYWPAYHADFAFFGQDGERGREVSSTAILEGLMCVLGPLCGGALVALFGFPAFFALMCLAITASNIPFFRTKEIFTPSNFSPRDEYRALFRKENRTYLLAYIGYGEELVAFTVWPVFLFMTFHNVLNTAIAVALSTVVTFLVLLYVGRGVDGKDRKRILRIGAIFTLVSWLLRVAIRGATGVFLVDFIARTSKGILAVPLLSGLYGYATKTSIVRTVVFFEMSLSIGKALVAGILGTLFLFFPNAWNSAFLLAAGFSLLYLLLSTGKRSAHPVAASL